MNYEDDYPEWDEDSNKMNRSLINYDDDNDSLLERVYDEDREEVGRLEANKKNIPENLVLTAHDSDIPIIYINSKNEKPEVYPVRLATITLNAVLPINFNLKVIALYLQLDKYVIGVKHEQVGQRGWFKEKSTRRATSKKANKGRKDKCDFYNQCTINIRPYGEQSDELINMKLFPNGKIGFTGVKKIDDATIALKIVLERINDLKGTVSYFPKNNESGNPKNFRKKLKTRQDLLEHISETSQVKFNWNDFIDNIITRGKNPYPKGMELSHEIGYVLCFLEILMTYYEFQFDKSDIYHHLNEEESNMQLNDKTQIWNEMMESIIKSFHQEDTNYTDAEFQLIIYGMAAEGRYMMTLASAVDFIRDYELEEIQVILTMYLQTNTNYDLERIIETLDEHEYSYEKIAMIKQHLLEQHSDTYFIRGLSRPALETLYHFLVASRDQRLADMTVEYEEYERTKAELDEINKKEYLEFLVNGPPSLEATKDPEHEPTDAEDLVPPPLDQLSTQQPINLDESQIDLDQILPILDQSHVDLDQILPILDQSHVDLDQILVNLDQDDHPNKTRLMLRLRDRSQELVEGDPNAMMPVINKLKRSEISTNARFTMELPAWSTKNNLGYKDNMRIMDFYKPECIHISNINTTFNTNFILSQEKLHQILNNKYGCSNCSFEPNYGGINLSYLSRIECTKHTDDDDEEMIEAEYDGCQCKSVSILIFPNITLITGGRSFRQIIDSYNFIKRIILTEFERILKIDQNCPDPLDRYPNVISSTRYVYLKKKYILDNPKNHFIIKKMGLLDHYLYK
jgi:hypothetical protein